MNLETHAQTELQRAGLFDKDSDYGGMVGDAVMELVKAFAAQGHSGFSAGMVVHLFSKVAKYETLTPMENPTETGEYIDHSNISGYQCWQSTRDSAVFSEDGGKTWYHLDKYRTPWQRFLVWLNFALPDRCPSLPKRWMRGRVTFSPK